MTLGQHSFIVSTTLKRLHKVNLLTSSSIFSRHLRQINSHKRVQTRNRGSLWSLKSEVGSRKSEVRSWKSGVRSPAYAVGRTALSKHEKLMCSVLCCRQCYHFFSILKSIIRNPSVATWRRLGTSQYESARCDSKGYTRHTSRCRTARVGRHEDDLGTIQLRLRLQRCTRSKGAHGEYQSS